MLVTKRADASTLSVVNAVKAALPDMQAVLPPDIHVSYEFDQSPYVTRAIWGVVSEGALGAVLVGLMILLFLRDWRSAIIVLLNIPLALMAAVVALWLTGQTINLMTLGGLALAIGILVDEATVEIENIHSQMEHAPLDCPGGRGWATRRPPSRGSWRWSASWRCSFRRSSCRARRGRCSCPCRWPSASRWWPPTCCRARSCPCSPSGCLRHVHLGDSQTPPRPRPALRLAARDSASGLASGGFLRPVPARLRVAAGEDRPLPLGPRGGVSGRVVGDHLGLGSRLGTEIFPTIDTGQFRLRMRAPDGTDIDRTEQIVLKALEVIKETAGADNVEMTLGYLGTIPSTYPINAVFQWMRGPEDAVMWVALKRESGIRIEPFKEELRGKLAQALPDVQFSFEPADIINEVMSFGSPTPVEVAVSGPDFAETRPYAAKLMAELGEDSRRCGTCRSSSRSIIPRSKSTWTARRRERCTSRRSTSPGRWPRPPPPAASPCRTSGPIRRPASATRCRWKCRGRSCARRAGSSRSARSPT